MANQNPTPPPSTPPPTNPIDKPGPKGVIQESTDSISLNLIEELWRVFCENDPKGKTLKKFPGSCNQKLIKKSVYPKFLSIFHMFADMKEGTMMFFLGHVNDLGLAFSKKGDVLKSVDMAKKPNLQISDLKKKMGNECYYWIKPEVMF